MTAILDRKGGHFTKCHTGLYTVKEVCGKNTCGLSNKVLEKKVNATSLTRPASKEKN